VPGAIAEDDLATGTPLISVGRNIGAYPDLVRNDVTQAEKVRRESAFQPDR
jgi:hypothetical protein